MIYDGHAYCFPDQRGASGFADPDEFRRHLQLGMAGHFQPAWRAKDRAPADSSGLYDPAQGLTFAALKDANFRPAGHGRFEWTIDGVDYVKQVLPPSVTDMSYPADPLVAEMDYAGVDWALLHRTPYLGIGNDFIADCVRRFPDRLHGLAYVEEWLIEPDPEGSIRKLERAINEQGLSGLQFLPNYLALYDQPPDWDGPGFRPFWDAVANLGVPVFFTPGAGVGSPAMSREETVEIYLEELRRLRRWMERYPDVTVVLTHGFIWRLFVEGDELSVPEQVLEAAPIDHPNFHLQLLFAIFLAGDWDYPLSQVQPTLEQLVHRIGADRLLWGTDMPMILRFMTYRQSLDFIRRYCDFLSPQEMDLICGGNMARLMGLEG